MNQQSLLDENMKCILDKEIDIDTLTSEELRTILNFVRGDDLEGACPLD